MKAFKLKYIFGILALLVSAQALAGAEGGGGGNVVVFYTDHTKLKVDHFELYDYWEQPKLFLKPYALDLGPANWSVEKKVNYALDRLAKYDLWRSYLYRNLANAVLQNMNDYYLEDSDFGNANDDNSPIAPPKDIADKVRIAVNFPNAPASNKPFLFSKFLFTHPKMTNDVRAGAILHEVAYKTEKESWFGRPGETFNSDPIRRFNYIMSSNAIPNLISLKDYNAETNMLPLGRRDTLKIQIKDCQMDIFINVVANGTYLYLDRNDTDAHDINVTPEGSLASWDHFTRHCNNNLGYWVCDQNLQWGEVLLPADLSSCGQQNLAPGDYIKLDRAGTLLSVKHQNN